MDLFIKVFGRRFFTTSFVLFITIVCCAATAQAQKQNVVVGAVGEDPKPGLRKALETQIKEAFVKDGRYTAVTREEAVLTAVDNEQAHQRTGAVDDAQVRQIGKQSGAKYVCVVEIAPLMNSYTLSAQFVDIESANIVSMASVTNMLRNPGDFLAASEELVRKLLGYEQKPTAAADKKAPVKYVAVIETRLDTLSISASEVSRSDLMEVTTVLRREAVKNLPRDKYNVMTSETVQSMGAAMVEDCADENCIVTIGSKIGADYVVRGILSKPRGRYSLAVEIFETEYGNLVAVTSEPIRSADFDELIDKTPAGSATMYRSLAGLASQPLTAQNYVAPTANANVNESVRTKERNAVSNPSVVDRDVRSADPDFYVNIGSGYKVGEYMNGWMFDFYVTIFRNSNYGLTIGYVPESFVYDGIIDYSVQNIYVQPFFRYGSHERHIEASLRTNISWGTIEYDDYYWGSDTYDIGPEFKFVFGIGGRSKKIGANIEYSMKEYSYDIGFGVLYYQPIGNIIEIIPAFKGILLDGDIFECVISLGVRASF